ncbi:hypothetical protein [Bacillus cereus]
MNLTGTRNIEQKQERLAMLQAFLQLEEIAKMKQYLEGKYEVPYLIIFYFVRVQAI